MNNSNTFMKKYKFCDFDESASSSEDFISSFAPLEENHYYVDYQLSNLSADLPCVSSINNDHVPCNENLI